jgi:osmotically-inducible protein OsmY
MNPVLRRDMNAARVEMTHMRSLGLLLSAVLLLGGCVVIARKGYEVATDERSVAMQQSDKKIALTIKKDLLQSSVQGTGRLDVFCRNGVVVLAGVAEPGSPLAAEAVKIATGMEGVRRVETYFVPSQPSKVSDFTVKEKIHAKLIGDRDLKAGQVDMAVIGGHVVLVGIVDRQEKVDKIVAHARSTQGVVAVKSFLQLAGQ